MKNDYNRLRSRLFFTVEELSRVMGIKHRSAWVLCSRLVKSGRFVRIKRNFYILDENWRALTREGFFKVGNFIQVPSYVSLVSALSYYEATTQVLRNYVESISRRRSGIVNVEDSTFRYYKMNPDLFFGFEKHDDFFMATREKALADAIYLRSFGKYDLDMHAVDMTKFNIREFIRVISRFPERTRVAAEELCRI